LLSVRGRRSSDGDTEEVAAMSYRNLVGTALVLACISLSVTAPPALAFTDVSPDHPYHEAISHLADLDVIDGYNDGTFRPDQPIWRAQFAKMILGADKVEGAGDWSSVDEVVEGLTSPFTDLGPNDPGSLYPHEYIAVAWSKGLTKGVTPTEFAPWREITRAQVVTMAVRALKNDYPGVFVVFPWLLSDPPDSYRSTWGPFSPTHGENARWAEFNGLLQGLPLRDEASDPWASMSRGEVAQVLYHVNLKYYTAWISTGG
jgi:hypothetical protein